MNRLEKITEKEYLLTLEDGSTYTCGIWYEKKVDRWHVIIPKEARELCGRTYIRTSFFDKSNIYEFETKTEHREGLASGGWKSRLTDEEKKKVEEAEKFLDEMKKVALSREPKKMTEEEKALREYERLKARLEKMGVKLS